MLLAALALPRPWLWEFHIWGKRYDLGFPMAALSLQYWALPEPKWVIFPDVVAIALNLLIACFLCFVIWQIMMRSKRARSYDQNRAS